MTTNIPEAAFKYIGPSIGARVLFITPSPTYAEMLRGHPFVGHQGELFEKAYLAPLGLTRAVCAFAWYDPQNPDAGEAIAKCMQEKRFEFVLNCNPDFYFVRDEGAPAKRPGGARYWNLPAVEELVQKEAELVRKCVAVRRALDQNPVQGAYSIQLAKGVNADTASHQGESQRGIVRVPLVKALPQKRIVYGVVLDPYIVDAHEDWIPPADVEATAHGFMKQSRLISLQHKAVAPDAYLVESSTEAYPTESDREAAHQNKPHRAFKRRYGTDWVHSGAWLIGVELSPELWAQYESGDIDAFSIEGFGERIATTQAEMPEVEFVELDTVRTTHGKTD